MLPLSCQQYGKKRGRLKTSSIGKESHHRGRIYGGRARLSLQLELQSMVLPALLFIFVFSYIPMYGIIIAFKDFDLFDGIMGSPWVGLKHFRAFFNAREFWLIMRNTMAISVLKLAFGFTAPIAMALMINEIRSMHMRRIFQTISYLPHFVSWVIVSGMVISLLSVDNGSVNILLQSIGLIDRPINWLSERRYFWALLVGANVWKDVGFGAIIYLAAIAGVNPELYEAASIDGAGRFKQIFIITLPCIKSQIIILFILAVSRILEAGFEDILLLTNFGQNAIVRPVSDVISTYVFRVGIENQRFSYATAAELFRSIVNIGMLVSANALSRRYSETSLW